MGIKINLSDKQDQYRPRIFAIGVGRAGIAAVNRMIDAGLQGVTFMAVDTDAQTLSGTSAHTVQLGTVQLGDNLIFGSAIPPLPPPTPSLCGDIEEAPLRLRGMHGSPTSKPDVVFLADAGRQAAEECLPTIIEAIGEAEIVFIAAGMGGGTASGAVSVIAKAVKEAGVALTVGVITTPFYFEGKTRLKVAEIGIAELRPHVDSLLTIPSDNLLRTAPKETLVSDILKKLNDTMHLAVRCISDLQICYGMVNIDLADIASCFSGKHMSAIAIGTASGENRAKIAAMRTLAFPLLENNSICNAYSILINITGAADITLDEIIEATEIIQKNINEDAILFFATVADDSICDEIRITALIQEKNGGKFKSC